MAVAGTCRRGSRGCLPGLVRRGGKAASHGYFMHCRSLEAAGHEHEPEPRLYSCATWAIGATGRVRLMKREPLPLSARAKGPRNRYRTACRIR